MKKISIVLTFILIILFAVFAFLYYNLLANYTLKSYSIYKISYNIGIKNSLDKPADLFVLIPQIKTIKPQQKIYDLSINKKYNLISNPDKSGSYLIKFENLKPGREEKIQINFKAKIYHTEQKLISKKFANPETVQYLKSEPDIETDSPLIKNMAVKLTKNEDNDYYKFIKLYDFTRENLTYEENKNCSTALEVLKSRKAQCADSVLLLMALCRSINIPAKFCAGIFYNNKDGIFTKTHSWAKIFIKNCGWIYADPTLGRFNPESRYYCLAEVRDKYITLWENDRTPFSFYLSDPNADKNKIEIKTHYKISKIKEKKLPRFENLKLSFVNIKNTAPVSYDNYALAGLAEYSKNNSNKASEYFKQSFNAKQNSFAYKMYIGCFYGSNKLKQAEIELNALSAKSPENPYYLYCLGLTNAYYNNYSISKKYFEKAINLDLKDEYIYNSLAYIYMQTKEIDLAGKNLIESLKYSTHYKNVFENLIYLGLIRQNWNKVIFWSKLAMKYNSNNPEFDFNGRCAFAYLNLNDYKMAEEYTINALRINPQNTWLNLMLGKIYYMQGNISQAYKKMNVFIPKATIPEKEEFLPLYEKIKKEVIN